ncbi:hypothetical protein MTAT_19940 [Moorella thermoacetica]|uniref:Uncharacterized protein n=1 Tax=Neomoorella thermoacetica TaxID=1525 RepID=A0AAC9HIP8_NEOTH|nr:hypothetical protein [Moorella thermoacetica]AOQ24649.1 hypothetical protein Maut_02221 [Moorella thermoacetica]TYL12752.1 hypothetical protein MTAT_19940 [Moorella thermoacetica]
MNNVIFKCYRRGDWPLYFLTDESYTLATLQARIKDNPYIFARGVELDKGFVSAYYTYNLVNFASFDQISEVIPHSLYIMDYEVFLENNCCRCKFYVDGLYCRLNAQTEDVEDGRCSLFVENFWLKLSRWVKTLVEGRD